MLTGCTGVTRRERWGQVTEWRSCAQAPAGRPHPTDAPLGAHVSPKSLFFSEEPVTGEWDHQELQGRNRAPQEVNKDMSFFIQIF